MSSEKDEEIHISDSEDQACSLHTDSERPAIAFIRELYFVKHRNVKRAYEQWASKIRQKPGTNEDIPEVVPEGS